MSDPARLRPVVLLVDDMPANIGLLASTLGDDYDLLVATDGARAVEVAGQFLPDLILLDVIMPGMDGYQVCGILKANPATRAIPVIFVTGQHQEEDETLGFELGAVDYITKPFAPSVVRARVRTHLELKNYRDFLEDCSYQERLQRLRLEQELHVAREVQMRLLPAMAAFAPHVEAKLLPAKEVAGDYFDLFTLADGRIAFMIADVSGKGTSAAFYAVETKGVLQALDKEHLSPIEVVDRINTLWCADPARQVYMTLVYGHFDPPSGRFAFVRAGHPPAMLRRIDGRGDTLEPRGLAVGFVDKGYREFLETCEGSLEPGECLIFYTDGLTEASGPEGELLGEERALELLAGPSEGLLERILEGAQRFAEGGQLDDDLTVLILRRLSAESSRHPDP